MKKWEIKINENIHFVTYDKGVLTIDGVSQEIKCFPISFLTRLDIPINIGGKECRFVLVGNDSDIAVDGLYTDSKERYFPIVKIPIYSYIFSIIFLLCSILGIIFGKDYKYVILAGGVLFAFNSILFGTFNIQKKNYFIIFIIMLCILQLLMLLDFFV